MTESTIPWIILLLPLAASAAIVLLTLRQAGASVFLSCAAIIASFGLSLLLFFNDHGISRVVGNAEWLHVGSLSVGFGLTLDPLSKLMLLIVTGVGSAIHIYAIGYMRDDPSQGRFFAKMSFFTFSMLGIVLASNFIQLFIFWELVGVSSYLLIGFWYERASAAEAAKKAFLVNRIGDFGFMLGILLVWMMAGSVEFGKINNIIGGLPAVVGILIFCGCVGKSAQFPLHVWLPDAMEGPTPVSALIHAATMVAAGVYMLCRVLLNIGFEADAMNAIAWTGGITALISALIACVQNDIKRILAYSTLSQLGYMVMAVGLAGTAPAMFHLTTHAFFKALLFLSAGSVIVALHHQEQNIWNMGGLRTRMKFTFLAFAVGALAMSGVLPLSGFWSKDTILAVTAEKNTRLFGVGLLTAGLTAFYIWRLVFVVFLGPARSESAHQAKESPLVMTLPLAALAALSVVGGAFAVPRYLGAEISHAGVEIWGTALVVSLLGLGIAWSLYGKVSPATEPLARLAPTPYRALVEKLYFDRVYDWLVANVQQAFAAVCNGFDRVLISGVGVRGLAWLLWGLSWIPRAAQSGNLGWYVWITVTGLVVVVYLMIVDR